MGTYLSPRTVAPLKVNIDDVAAGILAIWPREKFLVHGVRYHLAYHSVTLSLNVLLTLMIVVRLVLRSRNVRAATKSPTGFGGLYRTIATMLIESSALFAVSSLLVIGPLIAKSPLMDLFLPILAETQVRAFHQSQSSDRLSHTMTTDWTGYCFTAHHSTSCRSERIDE